MSGFGTPFLQGISIDAAFTPFGASGDISVMVVYGRPAGTPGASPAIGGGGLIASWPDDTYCTPGVSIPIDLGEDPLSVGAALDHTNSIGAGTLAWGASETTELTTELVHEGASGCFVYDDGSPGLVTGPAEPDEPPFLEVGGRLHLTTVDGRLDHSYDVRARASAPCRVQRSVTPVGTEVTCGGPRVAPDVAALEMASREKKAPASRFRLTSFSQHSHAGSPVAPESRRRHC